MKSLALIALLLACTACSLSPKAVTTPPPKPHLAAPSPTSMAACNDPVDPQDGPATQAQTEALWGADTDSLLDCKRRHQILANYIRKRDAGLTGAVK